MALSPAELEAVQEFREAYLKAPVSECLTGADAADFWKLRCVNGWFGRQTKTMASSVSNKELSLRGHCGGAGELKMHAQQLESLCVGLLGEIQRQTSNWELHPTALVCDELRAWLVGSSELKEGVIPLRDRNWGTDGLEHEVRLRVELCHLLKEAPSKVSNAKHIPGIKGDKFQRTMQQLAHQLQSQVQKGILSYRQCQSFNDHAKKLRRYLRDLVFQGVQFAYYAFKDDCAAADFNPVTAMTTKQAELYESVIGRLILEFLSDKSVQETLDLAESHSQQYLPILDSEATASEAAPVTFQVEGLDRDVFPRMCSLLTVLKACARCYSFFTKQELLFAGFGRLYMTNNGRLFRDFLDLLEVSMKQGEKDLSDLSDIAQEAQEAAARNQWRRNSRATARLKNYQVALSYSQALRKLVPSGQDLLEALRNDLTNTGSYPEVMADMKGRIMDLMDLHKFTMQHFNGWLDFCPSEPSLPSIAGEPASQPAIETASPALALESVASWTYDPIDFVQDAFNMLPPNLQSRLPMLKPQFQRKEKLKIAVIGPLKAGKTSLINMLLMGQHSRSWFNWNVDILPVSTSSMTHCLWRISASRDTAIYVRILDGSTKCELKSYTPGDLDSLIDMLPAIQKTMDKTAGRTGNTCSVHVELPKSSTFTDGGQKHAWERPPWLDKADIFDTPGLGDTSCSIDCDKEVEKLLQDEACVFIWCIPYDQGSALTACCHVVAKLSGRAAGCMLPVITKMPSASVGEPADKKLFPDLRTVLNLYASKANQAAEKEENAKGQYEEMRDGADKYAATDDKRSSRSAGNVSSASTEHAAARSLLRNLQQSLPGYQAARELDKLCSAIRILVPGAPIAIAARSGPCNQPVDHEDRGLLEALANAVKYEFIQHGTSYAVIAELIRLEACIVSAVVSECCLKESEEDLLKQPKLVEAWKDAAVEYRDEYRRILHQCEDGLPNVISTAHETIANTVGLGDFIGGRPRYMKLLGDEVAAALQRHYWSREASAEDSWCGQVAVETCRLLSQQFKGHHGCLGEVIQLELERQDLEELLQHLEDDLVLKRDVTIAGQALRKYSVARVFVTPKKAAILTKKHILEGLVMSCEFDRCQLHMDSLLLEEREQVLKQCGSESSSKADRWVLGEPSSFVFGAAAAGIASARVATAFVTAAEMSNPLGWACLGATGAAGLAAHGAWSYEEAQADLKARILSRVEAAKEEEVARFAALEEKMRRFMGKVVRSFLRRLVADPEACRELGEERKEWVSDLRRYLDEVKSRLNSEITKLTIKKLEPSAPKPSRTCAHRCRGEDRMPLLSDIPPEPCVTVNADGELKVHSRGATRQKHLDPGKLPAVKCWRSEFMRLASPKDASQ